MDIIDLVEDLQKGSTQAFDQIFELYKERAAKTAYLITRDRILSDDIVQETFVQCYCQIKTLKDPELFQAWFFRILTRIAWKQSKQNKREVLGEDVWLEFSNNTYGSAADSYLQKEQSMEIQSAIEKLDMKQKTVVVLYYFNELSIKEIAKIMGCFEGTVKSRLHNARKNLRILLEEQDQQEMEDQSDVKIKII